MPVIDGYVSKPLKAEDLVAAMEQVVARNPETTAPAADRRIDQGDGFDV